MKKIQYLWTSLKTDTSAETPGETAVAARIIFALGAEVNFEVKFEQTFEFWTAMFAIFRLYKLDFSGCLAV